jgi:hypothetical protein
MDLQLTNKKALVTGSTAGIGFAIAWLLAEEGASVVVNGRSPRLGGRSGSDLGLAKKCLRAKVLLPELLGPIRTTSDSVGIEIFMDFTGHPTKLTEWASAHVGGSSFSTRCWMVPSTRH